MQKRFVSVWFRHLMTDWFALRDPELKKVPFVLRTPVHGRMTITAVNEIALEQSIFTGMVLADAKAVIPDLVVQDDLPDLPVKLLNRLGEWCIRFSPSVAIDPPDGLILDVTGCAHLWGGERPFLDDINAKLRKRGYVVRSALANTPGIAWAMARFGNGPLIVEPESNVTALLPLPPEALRLDPETISKLHRLGLHQIEQFLQMPRPALRRRFGPAILQQIDKAIGQEMEILNPIIPVEPYQERLPCMDPILTLAGIEIALQQLLEKLCSRLKADQKGLRSAMFKGYRVDGKTISIEIGTSRPSNHVTHLFKLFQLKMSTLEPGMGIELFILEAPKVEDHQPKQEKMWDASPGLEDIRLAELLDRLAGKISEHSIHRFLPDEHYWPERSMKEAVSLEDKPDTNWQPGLQRPVQLLRTPEKIEVTAPIPDYPPMLFRYKNKIHKIVSADGPERIEQEWWIQQGQHRDYYCVEDEEGKRYWLFRLGHYDDKIYQWFLHGFFA